MSKHTPGPWTNADGQLATVLKAGLGPNGEYGTIAICDQPTYPLPFEELRSNASLIAAAPELLDGLKQAVEELSKYWFRGEYNNEETIAVTNKLGALINKAEGRE